MDPFDLIIGDCWEAVLEKLRDPLDKLSVVQCHPYLEEFFDYKIGEWKLLASLLIMRSRWCYTIRNHDEWITTVLKCRLLNSSCRSEIDDYLEVYLPRCELFSEQKVENCLAYIESNPSRPPPILNGAIKTYCNLPNAGGNTFHPMFDRVITLLSNMAPAVKKVNLSVCPVPTHGEASTLIRRLLSALPNIQQVALNLYISPPLHNEPRQVENNEVMELPDLPRLTYLHIIYEEIHEFPPLLPCPDLSQTFHNLGLLVLPLPLWKPEYSARNLLFPNLSYFGFKCVKVGNADDEEKVFNFFTKFNAPKLQIVTLDFSVFGLRKDESFYFMKTLICNCLKEMHPDKKCSFHKGDGNFYSYMMFFVDASGGVADIEES